MFIHQIAFKIWVKITGPWTKGQQLWPTLVNDCVSVIHYPKLHIFNHHMRQSHRTMKYRSPWPTCVNHCIVLTHYPKVWYSYVNTLQDMKQNYWTMKYRWPKFIEVNHCITLTHYPKVWNSSKKHSSQLAKSMTMTCMPRFPTFNVNFCDMLI